MKDKIIYLPASILTLTTVFAGMVLSASSVTAATTGSKTISVTVASACEFTSASTGHNVNMSIAAGTSETTEGDGRASFTISCSDANGFSVHAIGSSPDQYSAGVAVDGNTSLYGSVGTIPTGTAGPGSYWAFKITSATSNSTYTIVPGYNSYSAVPGSLAKIIDYDGTTGSVSATLKTDYKVSVAATQAIGSYTGGVKYTIVSRS